ncbi:splicing factor 3A subunit 1 [Rhipicephalus sanguineus]|uniref:splicing factor 3A subunit 1 n=1 Tax=Rhipicephalus sanguineus TaxID=34632 RepID=UPI0018962ABD|nr:splicing factor 3A subunit 1 [Rhipicephalus sanguineus]
MPPTVEDAVVLPPMEEQAPKEDAAPSTASDTAAVDSAAPPKEPAAAPAAPEQPTPPPAPAPPAPAKAPTIGIIYPPPELRNIVDKTAAFVARNGPEFEARIRQNEINNSKFNFLNSGDPYNAYYQHKVKEAKEGKIQPELALAPTPTKPGQQQQSGAPASKQDLISKVVEQPIVPKEPPPDFEFVADPPSISALDLDIVKLTAQFVARNGRQFLTNLMNREQRNYQFDFLRPQHSLFNYFMKLLEQYTKILVPGKDLMPRLKRESEDPKSILDQVRYRVEWTKLQEAQKRREEEEAERERVQYAQIDWHDFVVVETVDYQPNEQGLFPPPTTPDEVGSRVLAQQRMEEEGEEVEMEVESDEEGGGASDKEDEDTTPTSTATSTTNTSSSLPARAPSPPPQPPKEAPPQLPPLPPNPEQVVVRKDYNPKGGKPSKPSSEQYLISPITGEKIPADKMQEHMRIGLLDPRWVEQRDRAIQEKMQQDEVFAPGSAIESSLKQFAERRTDIFGFGDEETAIGKKIGEEDRRPQEKVTWDGHTASMEAATRAARANITIEEQIQQIHKIKGLLPDEEKERIGPAKPQHGSQQQHLPPLPPSNLPPLPPPPVSAAPPVSAPKPPPPKPPPPPQAPPPKSTAPPTLLPPAALRTQMAPVIAHPPVPTPPRPMMAAPQGLLMSAHLRPPPGMLGMPQGAHPPMAFAPMPPAMAPLPPEMPPSLPADDEPPSKKSKTEENLIPEAEFLAKNKGPVTVRVQVPGAQEKVEWKLNGQVLTMTLPLTDTVSVLKAKLHEELGMPPGKQKLQYEGMFVKDSNTLAYYNLGPNSTIVLQVKERGGRKK